MYCDSHVHIVGDPARYKQAPDRPYTAGIADFAVLQRLAARRGIVRFVIVQPSFYLTDNTLLLESLDALGGQGRGVAVLDPEDAPPELVADYHARGVRGLRINLYTLPGGKPPPLASVFAANAALARGQGWHVEVIVPLALLLGASDDLARSPVPVVIDHYGLYAGFTPDDAGGRGLLALLGLPHVWVKLSAPYRCVDRRLGDKTGSDLARRDSGRGDGALRLGQRLAAYAAARVADRRCRGGALSRSSLRRRGGRISRGLALGGNSGHDYDLQPGGALRLSA